MNIELEAKFLDCDHELIRQRLNNVGAVCVYPSRFMRRRVFDYSDRRLDEKNGWIRVRDEGDKVTLSYKELRDRTIHGTFEVETTVGDFEVTSQFFTAIGFVQISYQETKREKWKIEETEITLDEWPWIPPIIEIESTDELKIRKVTKQLGLQWSNALHGSVENAYQKYYDFTEIEIDDWPSITFIPVPEWIKKNALHKD